MQRPLRLAGLPGDHRDCVRCRGTDRGLVEIIEQREAVRILPEKRDGVAVEMRYHHLRLLLHFQRWLSAACGVVQHDERCFVTVVTTVFQFFHVEHIAVVLRDGLRGLVEMHRVRHAEMRVIDAERVLGIQRNSFAIAVLDGARDQEWRDRGEAAVGVPDTLAETPALVRRLLHGIVGVGARKAGEQPVCTGVSAEIMVE